MATVLFVSPHQDDESLSMGAGIRKHIEAGHDVHTLLLCGGVESAAQPGSGLSRPAFGRARDDEFMRACRALGVPFANMHFARVTPADGTLSVQLAYDSIKDIAVQYPGLWLKAYSHLTYGNRHQDHINSGLAALQIFKDSLANNLRCYIEPWLLSTFPNTVATSIDAAANPDRVVEALQVYGDVDPKGKKYGIGFQSVSYFDDVIANPVSRYHIPVL
jgi:LmbE family N-acetylglucosaminyl deacetylase